VTISRRRFLKNATLGFASFTASSGIYFPKPGNSIQYNYVLGVRGQPIDILTRMISTNVASGTSERLFPDTPEGVRQVVEEVQADMTALNFEVEQTPYSKRIDSAFFPTWGRVKMEKLGINPGFGTTQFDRNLIVPVAYSGATTIGIDGTLTYLTTDQQGTYTGEQLDGLLTPKNLLFDNQLGRADNDGNYWNRVHNITYNSALATIDVRYDPPGVYDPNRGRIRYTIRGGTINNDTIILFVEF
jgi:hypothetical protein